MALIKLFALITVITLGEVASAEQEAMTPSIPEIPSPLSIKAYKQFWSSFDAYEKALIKKGKDKYQNSWLSIQEMMEKQKSDYIKKELEILESAEREYREHLEDHEFAQNLPYVYLNLAQILLKIADLKSTLDEDPNSYKQQSLAILDEMSNKFKDFSEKEDALYLKALTLTSLGLDKDAIRVWETLARSASSTLYGVHARVAAGDYLFRNERASDAMKYYKSALSLLATIDDSLPNIDFDFEKLRIQYRLIWSSYRSAKLKDAIETGIAILQPGRHSLKKDLRQKIKDDAIQLLGDALYETGDSRFSKSTLKRKILSEYAAQIGLRIMKNYLANRIHIEVVELGNYIQGLYPVSESAPDILIMISDAYEKLGRPDDRIKTLELLAQFLPTESLWRARHKGKFRTLKDMEEKAKSAALVVAEDHYKKAMSTGNPQYFEISGTYFNLLIKNDPNGPETDEYRLKRGHCYYFSGRYKSAADEYDELIRSLKVDHKVLKVASYQAISTQEKIWRESFGKIASKNGDPDKDPTVIQNLHNLEKAIEHFANRFPPKMNPKEPDLAVDALLIAAAANRDHRRFKEAEKYWQRVLLANPTTGQRALAIRGMVLSKVEGENLEEVIEMTRRYLRLEDWQRLGSTMGKELLGILSQAVQKFSEQLSNKGEFARAGRLQVSIAREFPEIPQRDKIYRDGSYTLAIGGLWLEAENSCNEFLGDQKRKKYRDDISYLKARSQEYQLKFADAAQSYYNLAKNFPKHAKAPVAIQKSYKLAADESIDLLAAQAAILGSKMSNKRPEQLALLAKATMHFKKVGQFQDALTAAEKRYKLARTVDDRLKARLALANAYMDNRNEDKALSEYNAITRRALANKDKLNRDSFNQIYGESHFHLAQEDRAALHDFRILERGGDLNQTIQQKMRYFESMVNHFSRSSTTSPSEWASQSRFMIGLEADRLADELISINRMKQPIDRVQNKIRQQAERLRKLARTQYSANLLAKSRHPREYKSDPWIKKSQIKLQGYMTSKKNYQGEDLGPPAVSLNIPQQWSL